MTSPQSFFYRGILFPPATFSSSDDPGHQGVGIIGVRAVNLDIRKKAFAVAVPVEGAQDPPGRYHQDRAIDHSEAGLREAFSESWGAYQAGLAVVAQCGGEYFRRADGC